MKEWALIYSFGAIYPIGSKIPDYEPYDVKHRKFSAETVKEAMERALSILKDSARRWTRSKHFMSVLLTGKEPRADCSNEAYFLRMSWSDKEKILTADDAKKCFRAYGEDAQN